MLRRAAAALAAVAVAATLASCGQASADPRTEITVWSWEPSMAEVIRRFEAVNPDIRVTWQNMSGYDNINTAIQDGYGMPDVMQVEYYALPQYAVSGQLLDLTDRVAGRGYADFFTPGTWSSVQMAGSVYGLPMDSGPMAFFYNEDVFEQAGVDASRIRTWDDYYEAARKLKQIGVYIAADNGDASFYDAMVWLAGGRPFSSSPDGREVTLDVTGDAVVHRFTDFWQRMLDEGLVDTRHATWSDGWKQALGSGQVASLFAGAWMPSLLLSDVPGTSGLWRVAPMPTADGSETNAENGGSAMAVLQSTRKPDAAFRFADFVTHEEAGIAARMEGGAFPADVGTMESRGFLDRTTIKDARGVDVSYFGGQRFNRVLAHAAETVSTGYRYLPFEVYARSDFRKRMGDAYEWARANQAYRRRERERRAGVVDGQGRELESLPSPGDKVTLMDGLGDWEADLREYGANQGFAIR